MDDEEPIAMPVVPSQASRIDQVKMFNVLLLGLSFMFVFTAFQTTGMISKNVIDSVANQTNGTYNGDAFFSSSIIYAVFAVSNWLAPSVVAVIGLRFSLFCGAVTYCLYIGQFLYPMVWALYVGSVLLGIGAAILWTAQGSALTLNSNKETMGRNSGIFWAMLQSSLLIGNLIEFFLLRGQTTFEDSTRFMLFGIFTALSVVGTLMMLPLRHIPEQDTTRIEGGLSQPKGSHLSQSLDAFKRALQLCKTRRMLLLSVTFAYTGLELTYFGGIYPSCVGQNLHFDDAKSLIGLTGMAIGAGEILGGLLFSILGKQTLRFGRDPIVILGFFLHMGAYYLSYLNFPDDCPIQETNGPVFMTSSFTTLAGGFLLGLGDACFNTQCYSILGFLHSGAESSPPAFALFKFTQSLAAAVAFFYAKVLLKWQLLTLVVTGVAGTATFLAVELSLTTPVEVTYSRID